MDRTSLVLVALVLFCVAHASVGQKTTASPPLAKKTDGRESYAAVAPRCLGGMPGANGVPGMPGIPGPHGPRGDKGRSGSKGQHGSPGADGVKGSQGLVGSPGKIGPSGTKGDRGSPGTKGDAGKKGDAAAAGPISAANWKQCVWKNSDGKESGELKECSFNKLEGDTALKVAFQGNMRVYGSGSKCNRWYFKFNGNECSGPMTIEAVVYNNWPSGSPELLHHRSFEGYCENLPRGAINVELWVGPCSGYTQGNANTGWESVSRIMIEEVPRSQ